MKPAFDACLLMIMKSAYNPSILFTHLLYHSLLLCNLVHISGLKTSLILCYKLLQNIVSYLPLCLSVSSAIDCGMSEWTEWSECNKSCGKGHTIRTRVVTMEPQFGGDPCLETIQRKKCKIRKCNRGQGNSEEKRQRKEQREKRRSKQGRAEGSTEHPG